MPPIVIQEHNLLLIVFLLLLGGGLIGAMCYAAHRAARDLPANHRHPFLGALGAVIILLALTQPGTDYVSPADQIVLRPPPTRLSVDINEDCPPAAPGTTAQVIFTVETQPDRGPIVTGCTRINERQYLTKGTQ